MPRRGHMPSIADRRSVEALAGYGVREAEISGLIGIDEKTLRKHYHDELDHGHTKANARVAENLFRKVTGEGREAVTAAIFWLKVRAGWRETTVHELSGPGGGPVEMTLPDTRDMAKALLLVLHGNAATKPSSSGEE